MGAGKVELHEIAYPELALGNRACDHGVILKTVATNICGSDQHMVRGRTTAPEGLILGHEITGEVVERGRDVEFVEVGDVVSVPFNIACGRCRNCKEGKTGVCLNVNPSRPGAAYGYVDMGGWVGGQAEYVVVPYADWNLLKFPDPLGGADIVIGAVPTGFNGEQLVLFLIVSVNPTAPGKVLIIVISHIVRVPNIQERSLERLAVGIQNSSFEDQGRTVGGPRKKS
jgi:glutathione-independent formaldehyde dehydrogenase